MFLKAYLTKGHLANAILTGPRIVMIWTGLIVSFKGIFMIIWHT